MRRTTRSQSRQTSQPSAENATVSSSQLIPRKNASSGGEVCILGNNFTPQTTGLSRPSSNLLNKKRTKLRATKTQLRDFIGETANVCIAPLTQALQATLVFAQEEAGTAICISPHGLVLTCSHCVADDAQTALDPDNVHWLIFATGEVVRATCVAWDGRRDLALLRITGAEPPSQQEPSSLSTLGPRVFSYASISALARVAFRTPLLCTGHPGSEDLEADAPGVATGYDVLHISEGVYRGLVSGQDPQDNSEIGALMHDCWTYWGHSGAPLMLRATGELVGLHSSWDDQSGMRRGVPLVALKAFLEEWALGAKKVETG